MALAAMPAMETWGSLRDGAARFEQQYLKESSRSVFEVLTN